MKTKTQYKTVNVKRNVSAKFEAMVNFIANNLKALNSLKFNFTEVVNGKRVKVEDAKCNAYITTTGYAVLKVPNFKLAKIALPSLKKELNQLDKLLTAQGFKAGKTVMINPRGSATFWLKSNDQELVTVAIKKKIATNKSTSTKKKTAKKKTAKRKQPSRKNTNK
jgi:hypothetical protein